MRFFEKNTAPVINDNPGKSYAIIQRGFINPLLDTNISLQIQKKLINLLKNFNSITDPIALDQLAQVVLSNHHQEIQKESLNLLYLSIDSVKSYPPIHDKLAQALLTETSWKIRKKTAWLLGEIKTDRTHIHDTMVQAILSDSSPQVQLAIAKALRKIQPANPQTRQKLSQFLLITKDFEIQKILNEILNKDSIHNDEPVKSGFINWKSESNWTQKAQLLWKQISSQYF